jgi:hypothetical protein
MSVITLPRRPAPPRPRSQSAAHRPARRTWSRLWVERTTLTKVAAIAIVAIAAILLGNAYATERQIEIHQLQTELLQAQSHYASQVAALTDSTAPARIASRAGALHLVVPSEVIQIPTVPLDVVLAPPTLNAPYTPISRQYR